MGRLVKPCKMSIVGTLHSFPCVFCCFSPLKKRVLDQVSDIEKNWLDYRKVARLGVFVYLKKESCTFSAFSCRHFLIRASRSQSQPSKRKSKLTGKHTRGMWLKSQEPYAMHAQHCQTYRKSGRIRASGQWAICPYGGLGVGFWHFWCASNSIM